jgi:hypothetical protein
MMFANNWICENQKFRITLDNDSNNDIMIRLVLVWFKVGVIIVQVREACMSKAKKKIKIPRCFGKLHINPCESNDGKLKMWGASDRGYHLF